MVKKRIGVLLLSLILCMAGVFPTYVMAEGNEGDTPATESERLPRIYDEADVLEESDEAALLEQLDAISTRHGVDVAAAVVELADSEDMEAYTDLFYEANGYGQGEDHSGILLLISLENRKWHMSTEGYAITAFTDAGLDFISEKFLPEMKEGRYGEAFAIYAEQCDIFLTQAEKGKPYDSLFMPKDPLSPLWIPGSILIGFLIALVCTLTLKSELKSVQKKENASGYMRKGSMKVTDSKDIFLYKHVDRTERETKDNSSGSGGSGSTTHTSASGRTHGGKGGSF